MIPITSPQDAVLVGSERRRELGGHARIGRGRGTGPVFGGHDEAHEQRGHLLVVAQELGERVDPLVVQFGAAVGDRCQVGLGGGQLQRGGEGGEVRGGEGGGGDGGGSLPGEL